MMLDTQEMILPEPGRAFEWRHTAAGPSLHCAELERHAPHLFTTRQWMLGSPSVRSDDRAAWDQVAHAAGLTVDTLHRPRQVHGKAVVLPSAHSRITPGDVMVARDPLIGIAVQSADCIPLLIVDPTTGAICAAHAGWRGLAAGVPQAAVQALVKNFGSRSADLVVAIGPSIGACCYQVGRDVRDAFTAAFSASQVERWFSESAKSLPANPPMPNLPATRRPDHWFLDCWMSAREQLEAAGVAPRHIFSADLCTASHPNVLCSYRRDRTPTGRMAAVIRSQPLRP